MENAQRIALINGVWSVGRGILVVGAVGGGMGLGGWLGLGGFWGVMDVLMLAARIVLQTTLNVLNVDRVINYTHQNAHCVTNKIVSNVQMRITFVKFVFLDISTIVMELVHYVTFLDVLLV